jgi:hypothetical protein
MQFSPCSKHLGDTPGLREATRGGERRIAVENLTDLTDARVTQMRTNAIEVSAGLCDIAIDSVVRTYEGAE